MTLPSQVEGELTFFDRFADTAHRFVSRPWFFAMCVGVVLLWLPSFPLFGDLEKWQLPINTLTTIITFLMVAVLENTTKRDSDASHHKQNAIALGLYELLWALDLEDAAEELEKAVGLERRESA